MRKAAFGLLLTCVAVWAQSASDDAAANNAAPNNAATEALKKRLEKLNLVNPPDGPKRMPLTGSLMAARVCAIPLLQVIPPGTRDQMPVMQPSQPDVRRDGDMVKIPAPACNDIKPTAPR